MANDTIDLVYEENLDELLDKLGIKEAIDDGKFNCLFCGDKILRENFYSLFSDEGEIKICCDKPSCNEELLMRRLSTP